MSEKTLFAQISHSRTADEVVGQVEDLILDGVLRAGDRLPGERDLAQQLDVSRPILRDALKELENRGLLTSQHGGGTFVADIIGQVFSDPVTALIARHPRAVRDYLEYRRELEGMTAELAANRATEGDRQTLTRIVAEMRAAHEAGDGERELATDVEFHNAIGEAAHNIILLHTVRACYRLLSEGIFFNRKAVFAHSNAGETLLQQHEAICEAIVAGDGLRAREAAQAHIDFVMRATEESERAGERHRVAELRQLNRQTGPAKPKPAASGERVSEARK